MSIAVGLDELRARIDEFATDAYLLTVSGDGRAHSVAVAVAWDGDEMVIASGGTSRRNATARPAGRAALAADPSEAATASSSTPTSRASTTMQSCVLLAPTRAVLHRPAPMVAATALRCSSR